MGESNEKLDMSKIAEEYANECLKEKTARNYTMDELRVLLNKDFSEEDLKVILDKITGMNGCIDRRNYAQIFDSFDTVKGCIRRIWAQDKMSNELIIQTFEELGGTAARPALISNILFLKDPDRFNICVPAVVRGLKKLKQIGVTWDKSEKVYSGQDYIAFNSVVNQFRQKIGGKLPPELVDMFLWDWGR